MREGMLRESHITLSPSPHQDGVGALAPLFSVAPSLLCSEHLAVAAAVRPLATPPADLERGGGGGERDFY